MLFSRQLRLTTDSVYLPSTTSCAMGLSPAKSSSLKTPFVRSQQLVTSKASLNQDYYHKKQNHHTLQYPLMYHTSQQYAYQSREQQQAIWHAQNQAAPTPFRAAHAATHPSMSSYQSPTDASRARQTSPAQEARAQQLVSIISYSLFHLSPTIA